MTDEELRADLELWKDRRCAICKRKFLPAPYHVYRVNDRYCCCYTCYLKLQRQLEEKKNAKKLEKQNERWWHTRDESGVERVAKFMRGVGRPLYAHPKYARKIKLSQCPTCGTILRSVDGGNEEAGCGDRED